MMCLFADLSFSLRFNASHATQKSTVRFRPHRIFVRMIERLRLVYRDCDSNPKVARLAAV
jgi:hypothetical protein